MIDSCGVAGGVYQWQGPAAAGGDYQPTDNAVRGDLGSMLPKRESGTVWTAGEEVEVAWTHKAWHGGGYQYVHGRTHRRTRKHTPTQARRVLPAPWFPFHYPAVSRPHFPLPVRVLCRGVLSP